jgi:hypothetical protein
MKKYLGRYSATTRDRAQQTCGSSMTKHRFAPGFRLSPLDVVVVIVGVASAVAVALLNLWVGIAIGYVVLHFFLFCNVLRMSRPLEFLWAIAFTALAIAAARLQLISWPTALVCAALLTIVLAVIESRRPSYHGVGWQTLNPRLPEWWSARVGDASEK